MRNFRGPRNCPFAFAAIALATAALPGCSTAPLSYLEAGPLSRVDPNLYPVTIISIDGGDFSVQKSRPVPPGPHSIVVARPGGLISGRRGRASWSG